MPIVTGRECPPPSRQTHRAKPARAEPERLAADHLGGEIRKLVGDAGRPRPQAFKAGDGYGMFLGKEFKCRRDEEESTLRPVSRQKMYQAYKSVIFFP